MMNKKELETLASKFGAIPAGLTKKEQIVPQYLSEEEFAELKNCPRSKEMNGGTQWPYIGGRKVYPLSGALNDTEKQTYYAYKKGLSGTGTHPRTKTGYDEEKAAAFRAKLEALGEKEMLAEFNEICPPPLPPEEAKKQALIDQLKKLGWDVKVTAAN